jgi:hypothetical protein
MKKEKQPHSKLENVYLACTCVCRKWSIQTSQDNLRHWSTNCNKYGRLSGSKEEMQQVHNIFFPILSKARTTYVHITGILLVFGTSGIAGFFF